MNKETQEIFDIVNAEAGVESNELLGLVSLFVVKKGAKFRLIFGPDEAAALGNALLDAVKTLTESNEKKTQH